MGTCAMKAREQGGVVDERLNVYGVQNLKIAGNNLTLFWKKVDTSLNLLFRLQYLTRKCRS
jgi:GMC oxidoreductase